jgi:hypothetical protein
MTAATAITISTKAHAGKLEVEIGGGVTPFPRVISESTFKKKPT